MVAAPEMTADPRVIYGLPGAFGSGSTRFNTWLMVLDVALYVPAGWLAAELVLRLKNRGA